MTSTAQQPLDMNYRNLEICIFDGEAGAYPVEIHLEGGPDFPRRTLHLDVAALRRVQTGAEEYGRVLGRALFAPEALGADYQETVAVLQSQQEHARIRLRIEPPELHALRWERLYHPLNETWEPLTATAETLFSRYVPTRKWGSARPIEERPLRVLVVIASPENLAGYGLDSLPLAEIERRHALFAAQPGIECTYLQSRTANPPTLPRLNQALQEGYHVVQFVGHGARGNSGETALFLEDATGQVAMLKTPALLEAFHSAVKRPHLCFLTACESAAYAPGDVFLPVGPKLVADGAIPAVVAMTGRVTMATARQFTAGFYERLLTHGSVDLAVHEARARIRTRHDWSVPALFSRLPENRLLALTALHPQPRLHAPNPFGVNGCISDPAQFYDRDEILRRVFEELEKGSNISLVGASQIGKSSVLEQILQCGPDRLGLPSSAFIYLDMQNVHNEADFFLALSDKLEIRPPLRGYELNRTLNRRARRYILCLDEIEKMKRKRDFTGAARSELRGLAERADSPITLVIASRSPLGELFPDKPDETSPLAGICPQLDLPPFTPDVARAFLHERLAGTGVIFTGQEINALLRRTGGHPGKLQRDAAELFERARKRTGE